MSFIDKVAELFDQHIVPIPEDRGGTLVDLSQELEADSARLMNTPNLGEETRNEALEWNQKALLNTRLHGPIYHQRSSESTVWFPSLSRLIHR